MEEFTEQMKSVASMIADTLGWSNTQASELVAEHWETGFEEIDVVEVVEILAGTWTV
jgi:uncharacterized protein